MTETPATRVPVDRTRYRRVVRFFARLIAHFVWWEIVLRWLLGAETVQRSFEKRWRRNARRFRALAVDLGGVLIKLGQFLSVRVDVLPRAVTEELIELQDEVPPVALADIRTVIEGEYGQPINQVFASFAAKPEAAASLAQVHRARLPSGEDVVVKVQRPRIDTIVETDLQAIRTAIGWLKRYRPIRARVDLDRLYAEFGRTTRNELDFVAERKNAEAFAANFAGDERVHYPQVYAERSTRRVLVMEGVTGIKITDLEALEKAGVDRREVARRLFDAYLKQVFIDNFVHADPHPGNLFVEPLLLAPGPRRPFRLVFVDFGMVATIPERVRKHLRDWLVGFATRNPGQIIRAYQGAGILLPGADLARLEEIEGELLDRYAGLTLREAQQAARADWHEMAREYRDVLYEMPFQIPTDLLFVGRAIAILSGIATTLDPDFDIWGALEPFARQVAIDEAKRDWRDLVEAAQRAAQVALSLPGQADRFFSQAAQGQLAVRTSWAPEATRTLRRVESAVNRLTSAVVFAALLLAGVAVYVTVGPGTLSYALGAAAGVALVITLARRGPG